MIYLNEKEISQYYDIINPLHKDYYISDNQWLSFFENKQFPEINQLVNNQIKLHPDEEKEIIIQHMKNILPYENVISSFIQFNPYMVDSLDIPKFQSFLKQLQISGYDILDDIKINCNKTESKDIFRNILIDSLISIIKEFPELKKNSDIYYINSYATKNHLNISNSHKEKRVLNYLLEYLNYPSVEDIIDKKAQSFALQDYINPKIAKRKEKNHQQLKKKQEQELSIHINEKTQLNYKIPLQNSLNLIDNTKNQMILTLFSQFIHDRMINKKDFQLSKLIYLNQHIQFECYLTEQKTKEELTKSIQIFYKTIPDILNIKTSLFHLFQENANILLLHNSLDNDLDNKQKTSLKKI